MHLHKYVILTNSANWLGGRHLHLDSPMYGGQKGCTIDIFASHFSRKEMLNKNNSLVHEWGEKGMHDSHLLHPYHRSSLTSKIWAGLVPCWSVLDPCLTKDFCNVALIHRTFKTLLSDRTFHFIRAMTDAVGVGNIFMYSICLLSFRNNS